MDPDGGTTARHDALSPDSEVPDDPKLDPAADLRARWLPSQAQTDAAVAALNEVPASTRSRCYAVVPMVQPGKEYGIWVTGQPVVCLPGVWVGENTSGTGEGSLSAARNAAEEAAEQWLREQRLSGTTAIAMIDATGHAAVFEGFDPTQRWD